MPQRSSPTLLDDLSDRCERCNGSGSERIMDPDDPLAGRSIVCRLCSGTGQRRPLSGPDTYDQLPEEF